MSQASPNMTDAESPENAGQRRPVGVTVDYIPTEEETRVFRECNQESFWYRSVPISLISMAVTQGLVVRGALTSSTRFGSLPKVAFAGVCGYLLGKISYMKKCQEKFKNLENSPIGEALRQRQHRVPIEARQDQSELEDPNMPTLHPIPQLPDQRQPPFRSDRDFNFSQPTYSEKTGTLSDESYLEEDQAKEKQSISYEDLRNRNRDNYEVTLTQKAEALLRPSSERPPLKKDGTEPGKKNIYGDVWEE